MKVSETFLAVLSVFIGFGAGCSRNARPLGGPAPGPALDEQPLIGQPAPDFRLKAVGGGPVGLADLRGKFLVVHFAATW